MDIGTVNAERIVNVGSAANLYSLYSTATTLMGRQGRKVMLGLNFLGSGSCEAKNCAQAARQLVKINKELAKHSPNDAVWDIDHPNILAPWAGHLAPTITSCAAPYTISEGGLLLPELISLLQHAELAKQGGVALG